MIERSHHARTATQHECAVVFKMTRWKRLPTRLSESHSPRCRSNQQEVCTKWLIGNDRVLAQLVHRLSRITVLTVDRYVRNLEERLRAREQSTSAANKPSRTPDDETSNLTPADNVDNNFTMGTGDVDRQPEVVHAMRFDANESVTPPIVDVSSQVLPAGSVRLEQNPTFAEELRALSLEATAERHLGSTSGLPFAKLTEKVLRRLTPDKADFVFVNYQENISAASLFELESPGDVFGENVLQGLCESISVHPVLFGDLFLADFTESDNTILDDLTWPTDEGHVQRLVDFYFAHSHTLYPILSKSDFMQTFGRIRVCPRLLTELPALEGFRLWMVLAIGSTAYSSVSLTDEAESRVYYSKALQYLEPALETDDMVGESIEPIVSLTEAD